jgi:two-component system sensor histidine kinase/response regulator
MKTKLLLIDDEVELLENLRDLLVLTGFQVDTATSGNKGIKKIQGENYDVLITDISMPDGDGYKVLEYVKSREDLVNIPLIFLTAKLEFESQRQGIEIGAEDYLMKPIAIDTLEKAIRGALSKKDKREKFLQKNIQHFISEERKVKYHELRTPLFGLLSAIEFLKSNWTNLPLEQISKILDDSHTSAVRMNKSLLNLQRWTELSQQKIGIKTRISAKEFLKEKIKKSDKLIDSSSSDIIFNFEKSQFDYIFEELISNARRFDPNEEGIEIFLSDKTVRIVNRHNYIENYGSFTPMPFSQINREKYEQQGLGLGLYLSKVYAAQNDFELTCMISENTFEVTLSSNV